MSNILYVIDGYLSTQDKVEVTLDLINQLRMLDPNREIMLINKFKKSWDLENFVDYYKEYTDGFLVGYPPENVLKSERYELPYVYFDINSGVLENWMPLVGVSDHVANVYNGFIFAIKEAQKYGYDKVFRIEYDMLFDDNEYQTILKDLNRFENEEFLIYGKRQEGQWAHQHQYLIDLHFCGYTSKMIETFDYVKNDDEFWSLCEKIGYFGKWSEYIIAMTFESNLKKCLEGVIYLDKTRTRFPKSEFDRLSSSGVWTDKWKDIPKISRLDISEGRQEDKTKLVIFYLNMDYDSVDVEVISNKGYHRKIILKRGMWYYDIVERDDEMVFMSHMKYNEKNHTVVTYVNNDTFDKLNCRFIKR